MDSSTCLVPTSFCYVLSVWSHIFQKQRGERKKERRKKRKKRKKEQISAPLPLLPWGLFKEFGVDGSQVLLLNDVHSGQSWK